MAISMILDQELDSRRGGEDCRFNGYLEDYLSLEENLDPVLREAFAKIVEGDSGVKICTCLKSEINKDAISNQIIRYKDVFKLTGRALEYPYILYEKTRLKHESLYISVKKVDRAIFPVKEIQEKYSK